MSATTHRIGPRVDARQARLGRLLGRQAATFQSRRQVLRDSLPSATWGVLDFEEQCLDAEDQGVGFSVLQVTARTLQQIEAAVRRLATGSHGTCADCGGRISEARLRALPFAALCLTCQEQLDAAAANGRGH
jgi:DnaK suppressor protein